MRVTERPCHEMAGTDARARGSVVRRARARALLRVRSAGCRRRLLRRMRDARSAQGRADAFRWGTGVRRRSLCRATGLRSASLQIRASTGACPRSGHPRVARHRSARHRAGGGVGARATSSAATRRTRLQPIGFARARARACCQWACRCSPLAAAAPHRATSQTRSQQPRRERRAGIRAAAATASRLRRVGRRRGYQRGHARELHRCAACRG